MEEMKKRKETHRIVCTNRADHTLRFEMLDMVERTIFNFQKIKKENDEGLLLATLINFTSVAPSYIEALQEDYTITNEATDPE